MKLLKQIQIKNVCVCVATEGMAFGWDRRESFFKEVTDTDSQRSQPYKDLGEEHSR